MRYTFRELVDRIGQRDVSPLALNRGFRAATTERPALEIE